MFCFEISQHRASEISKQNIAASYMETRYLLRNKIFEENTHIFGPPMVGAANSTELLKSLSLLW